MLRRSRAAIKILQALRFSFHQRTWALNKAYTMSPVDIRLIGSQVAEDEADSLKGYYLNNTYFQEASRFAFRSGDQISQFGTDRKHVFFIG